MRSVEVGFTCSFIQTLLSSAAILATVVPLKKRKTEQQNPRVIAPSVGHRQELLVVQVALNHFLSAKVPLIIK